MSPDHSSRPAASDPNYTLDCDEPYLVQGQVRVPVASAAEPVPAGLATGRRDGAGAAERCEGCLRFQAIAVLTGSDQQLSAGDGADPSSLLQPRVSRGDQLLKLAAECGDLDCVLLSPRQRFQ